MLIKSPTTTNSRKSNQFSLSKLQKMSSAALKFWKSITGSNRKFATATASKMKPYAPTADILHHGEPYAPKTSKGEFVPVYVALGMIVLSLSFGAHTAKQQIAYNPGVRVNRKRRETIPEVEDPDRVLNESEKYVNKSLFRKVAHIQDFDAVRSGITDPVRPDNVFVHPRHAETLKSVGINPRGV